MLLTFLRNIRRLSKYRNIRQYFLLTILTNLWFAESSWLFFWRTFISYEEIGIIDALAFGFGMFIEIPTGALADIIGKRNTIIASYIFSALGIFIMSQTTGWFHLLVGMLFFQLGFALYSGTAEALCYDSLLEEKQEAEYESVISITSILILLSTIVATFIGGTLLYAVHIRLPYIFWGLTQVVGLAVALTLKEPLSEVKTFTVNNYIHQLLQGSKLLFSKPLRKYIVSIFSILGIYFVYEFGILKPALAVSFGFNEKALGVLTPIMYILSAIMIYNLHKLRKLFGDSNGLLVLSFGIGACLLISTLGLGIWGFVPLILLSILGNLGNPWLSVIINSQISSEYRATVLSSVAFVTKLPYVFMSVMLGSSLEGGLLYDFNILLSIIIFASIFIPILWSFKERRRGVVL